MWMLLDPFLCGYSLWDLFHFITLDSHCPLLVKNSGVWVTGIQTFFLSFFCLKKTYVVSKRKRKKELCLSDHEPVGISRPGAVTVAPKLQALVYDIRPSTTAVFSYAIGSRKLSANQQFFAGAQTVVSLLQITQTQIKGLSFIATYKVYTSTNKTTIVWIETELFFFYPGWMHLWACLGTRLLPQSYQYPNLRRTLTASLDSCAEIKSAPSVA